MWFNISSLDRAAFLRYNLNTGQAFLGQPILETDGSFDFVNLSFRYTGKVSENTFQGQITQQGKPTITFSGTRKSDFGQYSHLRGSYTGMLLKGGGNVEVFGLIIAADGELFSYNTTDPTLTISTVGKGSLVSDSKFVLLESSGLARTGNFTLIDTFQLSGTLDTPTESFEFITYNTQKANHMVNISTRGLVASGDDVMIAGFVIKPNAKTVLIRGIGPSLSSDGVPNTLQDPMISVQELGSTGSVVTNDNWQSDSNAFLVTSSGLPPTDPREAALLVRLEPGAYTVTLSGVGGATGNGLIEVYEVD